MPEKLGPSTAIRVIILNNNILHSMCQTSLTHRLVTYLEIVNIVNIYADINEEIDDEI